MPVTAREIIKKLIQVYPVKEQKNNPNRDWLGMLRAKEDILFEMDLVCMTELETLLQQLPFTEDYMMRLASRFGTENVIIAGDKFSTSEESYYLTTGVLYGVRSKINVKFDIDLRIKLNKAGYHFTIEPKSDSKHADVQLARTLIKKYLYRLYGCEE